VTSFRTVAPDGPLRLVVVGAGGMGRAWMQTVARSGDALLAGVVDLDPLAA
jgi:predicted dehydrogenase